MNQQPQNNDISKQGMLLVNKTIGKTSFSIIHILRKVTNISKIGHTGTLDPFATGLMVILIGKKYTRLSSVFLNEDKQYLAKIFLGQATDTFDRDGQITSQSDKIPTLDEITTALLDFEGAIEQIPPMFSAKKINGKKLYELARKGISVERKKCNITVNIEFISYQYPFLELKINCSKGTYIRSLAHDIGQKLTCCAHLHELCRTKSGNYKLEDSVAQEDLGKPDFDLSKHLFSYANN